MLDIDDYQWAKDILKNLDFFSHCSEEDILALVESMEKNHYKAGSTILFQGEISNRLHLVRSGSVGIWKSASGQKTLVAELGPGKYFGEISLMTPISATASVKAKDETEILSLSYESLEFAFRKHPEEMKIIQKKIEERMQSRQAAPPPAG
ncbi:MAG: hypothetical protein A2636_02825 [Elusimicrobia bacterium RIFCSPHIGHO2_01_FULL_64_10]|nr:MAG: hypothetical protein A2636_02825 [Elusimicrobia bacterium RIFCSPHIGHO2_01_FULL_64_10]